MKLLHGDCLDQLKRLADNSVDAIVTDPPYGLSFMGKRWDYDVPSVDVWTECLRVLKPGGYLLAFAGTRTQHRMAVRIEDAGFEIRDMIAWVYGSGFPKSLDVSKALDKIDATHARTERRYKFTEWMVQACSLTPRQMDEICGTNTMGRHWTDVRPNGKQPDVPTREYFEMLRPHFGCEVPGWVEQMVEERTVESENFKRREVVGKKTSGIANKDDTDRHTIGASKSVVVDITAPATEAARQWQGWGTALKPALEPITVARKPLTGTVAENVLAWGTGGLNIDECRIAAQSGENFARPVNHTGIHEGWDRPWKHDPNALARERLKRNEIERKAQELGRWPANLIHDGSEEVLANFPSPHGAGKARTAEEGTHSGKTGTVGFDFGAPAMRYGDTGSAARFFYCAKASKRDRDEGLDGFAKKTNEDWPQSMDGNDKRGAEPRANVHPTVKPTDLMRYLCRLVTPPGGVVLDPFMGSGSTGKAAALEGFDFIGIEREAEYLAIADARIKFAQPKADNDNNEQMSLAV